MVIFSHTHTAIEHPHRLQTRDYSTVQYQLQSERQDLCCASYMYVNVYECSYSCAYVMGHPFSLISAIHSLLEFYLFIEWLIVRSWDTWQIKMWTIQ